MSVITVPNYLDAIVSGFPSLAVRCDGPATVYSNLSVDGDGTLPSQAELDVIVLSLKRERMWQAIQEERTRRQNGGVFIQSANKWFHSDQSSRVQQLGLVMMGANLPANINWKTMDGTFIIMTQGLALSIFNGAATLDMTAFAVAEQHRQGMLAAADPAAYNFSGFWPATFGG